MRGARLVGVGVGFAGVVLLVGVQEGGQLVAALAVLGTALCYAVAVLFAGRTMAGLPPVKVAAGQLAFGLLLLAPFGIAQAPDELPSADVLAAIAALGALGSGVAYLLYFALIARAGAARAILVTYLVPAFALDVRRASSSTSRSRPPRSAGWRSSSSARRSPPARCAAAGSVAA